MYDTDENHPLFNQPILEQIVRKYIFISSCTFGITAFTYHSVAVDTNWYYCMAVGMSTFLLYNYYEIFRQPFESSAMIFKSFRGWVAVIVSLTIALILSIYTTYVEWISLILASILSIYYFRPFTKDGKSLRDFLWLKPITIGLVFAIVTAVIPYHHSGYTWFESIWLSFGRLMFLSSLALVFDMGDIPDDTLQGVDTLPKKYGLKMSRYIAIIMLSLAFMVEIWGAWRFLIEVSGIMILSITYFISFWLMIFATPSRKWWYYLIIVDGMIGLPFLLLWL